MAAYFINKQLNSKAQIKECFVNARYCVTTIHDSTEKRKCYRLAIMNDEDIIYFVSIYEDFVQAENVLKSFSGSNEWEKLK